MPCDYVYNDVLQIVMTMCALHRDNFFWNCIEIKTAKLALNNYQRLFQFHVFGNEFRSGHGFAGYCGSVVQAFYREVIITEKWNNGSKMRRYGHNGSSICTTWWWWHWRRLIKLSEMDTQFSLIERHIYIRHIYCFRCCTCFIFVYITSLVLSYE